MKKVLADDSATVANAVRQARAHLDSLRYVLAPMLDSAQRVRADSLLAASNGGVFVRPRLRQASPQPAPPPR
jgi:hypothetical protein